MINILSTDILLLILPYLQSKENIYFLTTSTNNYKLCNIKLSNNYIKQILHTSQIFPIFPSKFSLKQKQIYNYDFYKNIPINLLTISQALVWFHVHQQLLKYYNINFFLNNCLLITSNKKMSKNEIYYDLTQKLKTYIHTTKNNSVSDNKSKITHCQFINNATILTTSKYWYHQLNYKEFMRISYEIFTDL